MNTNLLTSKFEKLGARTKIGPLVRNRWRVSTGKILIDIGQLERGKKGKRSKRQRRKTDTFVRQGEWFFIPVPGIEFNDNLALTNEPISRGQGSKPHVCKFLFREGGTTVHVCRQYPSGLTSPQYRDLLSKDTEAVNWNWRVMQRDPTVFVRGAVSHPDHATIHLAIWHRVLMNTENESRARASVVFLD